VKEEEEEEEEEEQKEEAPMTAKPAATTLADSDGLEPEETTASSVDAAANGPVSAAA
jgi:hypothetical protein